MDRNDPQTKLRASNKRAMLRLIRQSGSISRVQLAKKLKLSKSTVTENIAPLLQSGVVQEVGVGDSRVTGGRRPVLLHINGSYKYMVAAELGMREPIFALADLNGRMFLKTAVSISDDAPYGERLNATCSAIRALFAKGGIREAEVAVIALSSPGAYSATEKSFVLNPEFENWDVGQLSSDLERIFSTSVFRVNDVNAAALGEFYQGAGKNCENLLFISCGIGIGAGLILNGELFSGTSGSAGEIARIKVSPHGLPLRTQVEMAALLDRIKRHAPQETRQALAKHGKSVDSMSFGDAVLLWQEKDPYLIQCVDDIARYLGEALAIAVSLLNCSLVVFGGDYLVFEDQLVPALNDILQRDAFDPVRVVPSRLRQDAGLHGLLTLSSDALLERIAMDSM